MPDTLLMPSGGVLRIHLRGAGYAGGAAVRNTRSKLRKLIETMDILPVMLSGIVLFTTAALLIRNRSFARR